MPRSRGTQQGQFGLGQTATGGGHFERLVDPGLLGRCAQHFQKGKAGLPDQGREHEIRPVRDDLFDHIAQICFPDGKVPLAEHRTPRRGDRLAQDSVVFPGPDVIRSHHPAAGAKLP